jgi:hypothetical protein
MKAILLAFVAVTAMSGVACRDSSGPIPSVAGSWTATYSPPAGGTNTVTMTLTQRRHEVGGIAHANGFAYSVSGEVARNSTITLIYVSSSATPAPPFRFEGDITDGRSRLAGGFIDLEAEPFSGAFERQ